MKEIPISLAKSISEELGYDEIIIVGCNYEQGQHVTTYGNSLESSMNAAAGGNAIKQSLLKWPQDECNAKTTKIPTVKEVNDLVKKVDTNQVSDGYHTFGELYEHRIINYMLVCAMFSFITRDSGKNLVWMSKVHSDGSIWDGWFILGIYEDKGIQITYHLPISKWDECKNFAREIEKAPEYDGHTSNDVLERLTHIFTFKQY